MSSRFASGLNKLIKWVEKNNWDIYFGDFADEMNTSTRKITLYKRCSTENQLYALAHECGHLLLRKNKKMYKKRFPVSYFYDKKNRKNKTLEKTAKYRVELLEEEIEAWNVGYKLVKKLNIHINRKNFLKEKYRWVYTYIQNE